MGQEESVPKKDDDTILEELVYEEKLKREISRLSKNRKERIARLINKKAERPPESPPKSRPETGISLDKKVMGGLFIAGIVLLWDWLPLILAGVAFLNIGAYLMKHDKAHEKEKKLY